MSLHAIANHMAAKGRGPDSMLIHMAPSEVQGLQALAMAHGGSLSINPDTGLPEAGFLKKLLPMIIGAALAPMTAGTSLAFLGASPMAAAMTVGGFETLRTGDLGKGIMAGFGAYGGANLGASLAGAGASALGPTAGAGIPADIAANLTDAGVSTANADIASQAIQQAQPSAFDKIAAGAKSVTSSPEAMGSFAKDNFKDIAYAAGPILADEAVKSNMPTTTTRPGQIRTFSYDPYGQLYTPTGNYEVPVKAAGGGLMGMNDGGYNPGQLDFMQRSEPVVRMAAGGTPPDYGAIVNKAYENIGRSGIGTDVKNIDQGGYDFWTNALKTGAVTADDFNKQFGSAVNKYATQTPDDKYADYVQNYAVNKFATPTSTAADFLSSTKGLGLYDASLADALEESKLSNAARYALTHAQDDKDFTGGIIDERTGKPIEFYNTIGYKAGDLPGDEGGLKGYYANINYAVNGLQKLIDSGKMSVADAQNAALAEMERVQGSLTDVKSATGKDFGSLFRPKTEVGGTDGKKVITTPTDITTVDKTNLAGGVSGGGNTVVNPNGTITTRPDLSLGMSTVRDNYTKGGGSLGYTSPVVNTIEEFDKKYNTLTGGSKQSYDYLSGKTDYSPVPYTKTGEIMKPYGESVLGVPRNIASKQVLFDPTTRTYKPNPDYVPVSYTDKGEKVYGLSGRDIASQLPGMDAKTADYGKWMSENNVTHAQIAQALGISLAEAKKRYPGKAAAATTASTDIVGGANGGLMAMARGGMAQQFDLGGYSDGGRLLRGPGDGVSDSIPATIGNKRPARLADGEFVVPARIVSELGNGSTEAGARKLYAMMDRVQKARRGTVGKGRVAKNSRSEKYLPA
jgi:hypothetical protein